MPFSLGWPELMLFALIVLLLFGSRLPSVMRSLGQSVNEFKKGTRDAEQDAALTDESSPKK